MILHRSAVQWLHTPLLRTAPSMIKVVQKCDPCDYQSWLQAGKSGEIQCKTLGWHWWAGVVSTRSFRSPYFNIQGFNKPTQRQTAQKIHEQKNMQEQTRKTTYITFKNRHWQNLQNTGFFISTYQKKRFKNKNIDPSCYSFHIALLHLQFWRI